MLQLTSLGLIFSTLMIISICSTRYANICTFHPLLRMNAVMFLYSVSVECSAQLTPNPKPLTHWVRETHICVDKLSIIASDNYLNQCWNIVNWTLRNKLQWNFIRNSYIFIHENTLENVVCEMASILSRPQCVNVRGLNYFGSTY